MYISIYIYNQKTSAAFCCGLCVCRLRFSPAEDTSGCLSDDGSGASQCQGWGAELLADAVGSAKHKGCRGITGMKWTQRKRRWFCMTWSETSAVKIRVVEGTNLGQGAGHRARRMELYSQAIHALCWTDQHTEVAELSGTMWNFLAAFQKTFWQLLGEGLQEVAEREGVTWLCLA